MTPRQDAGLRSATSWLFTMAAFGFCLYFLVIGLLWIDALGIHTDEALFSAGIYEPIDRSYTVTIFKKRIPLMVMTYVGTLKSVIYRPIFAVWQPSAASTRIPVMVIGALTVWLFYRLLLRTCGARAALAGCALLATDPVFLLTTKWDWGPVAIQHFCLVAGVLLITAWHQERKEFLLAAGFFVFGLGLWDKAVFIWSLAGLAAGALAAFPRELFSSLRRRSIGIAVAAFLIGAMPLIVYNLRRNFVTLRSNTTWSADELAHKAKLVRDTLEGNALVGWTVRDDAGDAPRESPSRLERMCVALSDMFGHPKRSLMGWGFVATLLFLPTVLRRTWRPVLFSMCFLLITWFQMAVTKGAGTGPHHTVLLWPFPVLMIAVVFAAASYRLEFGAAGLTALICVLAASNVLVTSTYYRNQIRNGGTATWTDGVYPLSEALGRLNAKQVNVISWTFFDTIRLLHQGRIAIGVTNAPTNESERAFARTQCEDPEALFVGPAPGNDFAPGATERFVLFAAQEGFRRRLIEVFADSNGRQMIELFRFEREASAPASQERSSGMKH